MSVAVLTAAAAALPAFMAGATAPYVMTELGLTEREFGLVITFFFLGAAIFATRGGRLVDKSPIPKSVRLASGLTLLCLVLLATLPSHALIFGALLLVGGAGLAVAMPASNLLIMNAADSENRGVLFGVKQAAIPVATMLCGIAIPLVVDAHGWRYGFLAVGLIPSMAFIFSRSAAGGQMSHREEVSVVVKNRADGLVRFVGIGGGLGAGAASGFATFLVAWAVNRGISAASAGTLLAVSSVAGIISRVASGWIVDRFDYRETRIVAALLGTGALGFLILSVGSLALLVVGAIIGYAAGWGWPATYNMSLSTIAPDRVGTATGKAQVGIAIGGASGPVVFGTLINSVGYRPAWIFAALSLGVASGIFVYVDAALLSVQTAE